MFCGYSTPLWHYTVVSSIRLGAEQALLLLFKCVQCCNEEYSLLNYSHYIQSAGAVIEQPRKHLRKVQEIREYTYTCT
jgi:hypothetical protein